MRGLVALWVLSLVLTSAAFVGVVVVQSVRQALRGVARVAAEPARVEQRSAA